MLKQVKKGFFYICSCLVFMSPLANAGLLPIEKDTINVYKKVAPYVVNVHQTSHGINRNWQSQKIITGTGSGIILNPKGLIVTNYHVLGHSKKVDITLQNGKNTVADFIGGDPRKDVALLRMRQPELLKPLIHNSALALTNSRQLNVGQIAIAIGNPYGLDETLTEGVVSALNREIPGFGGVIINGMVQTDASINPGNSGGPLLDSQGQLIGMNTLIYSNTGGFSGIGFAIPSNTIHRIITQILKYGKVITPGIGIIPLPDQAAAQSGIQGLIIAKVMPGLPASKAGLKGLTQTPRGQYRLGDVITRINGKSINNFNDFYQILDKQRVGNTIAITIKRDGKPHELTLKTIDINS